MIHSHIPGWLALHVPVWASRPSPLAWSLKDSLGLGLTVSGWYHGQFRGQYQLGPQHTHIYIYNWLVVSTPLKNISQWEGLSHILWKIKNIPNHQPDNYTYIPNGNYLYVWWNWWRNNTAYAIIGPTLRKHLHFFESQVQTRHDFQAFQKKVILLWMEEILHQLIDGLSHYL